MEKMRHWIGTPRKSMNTFIWLCFVSLSVSVLLAVVTLLAFWARTIA